MKPSAKDSALAGQLALINKWAKDADTTLAGLCKAAKPVVSPKPIYKRRNGQEHSLLKPDTMHRLRVASLTLRGLPIDDAPVISSDFDAESLKSGEEMHREIAKIALDFLKKLPPSEARKVFNEYADWLKGFEVEDRSTPTQRA